MDKSKIKNQKRDRRRAKIRSRIKGTAACPRLSVFRSNRHVYAQLVDDDSGRTIISAHTRETVKTAKKSAAGKKAAAAPAGAERAEYALGELIAKKAKNKKIGRAVFDRGGYKYHGRVKAVADGARAGGMEF